MSAVGRKFSFLEAATTAEHVALLGHSVRKWVTEFPVYRSGGRNHPKFLTIANLMQIII